MILLLNSRDWKICCSRAKRFVVGEKSRTGIGCNTINSSDTAATKRSAKLFRDRLCKDWRDTAVYTQTNVHTTTFYHANKQWNLLLRKDETIPQHGIEEKQSKDKLKFNNSRKMFFSISWRCSRAENSTESFCIKFSSLLHARRMFDIVNQIISQAREHTRWASWWINLPKSLIRHPH